jgi:surfactin synthase thioesterase subunit
MTQPQATSPVLVTIQARAPVRLRLFVCPHAGSGAAPYRAFAAVTPSWTELVIARLPGRESLLLTEPFRAMEPLIEALLPLLTARLDVPFALFGHSFGARVAFELARALRAHGFPAPCGLIASTIRAPHLPLRLAPLHNLETPRFIEELQRYGGPLASLAKTPELMDLALPSLRADVAIAETHPAAPKEPFTFPISVFGGRVDHSLTREEMEAWGQHTTGRFTCTILDGGHFFLFEEPTSSLFQTLLAEHVTLFLND